MRLEVFMKASFSKIVLLAPVSLLAVACGTSQIKKNDASTIDSNLLVASDESEEVVADHVEDVAMEMSVDDNVNASPALGLVASSNSSIEKNCSLADGNLTLKKSKSLDKNSERSTKKGNIERSVSLDTSFERIYKPATGSALPVECKTAQGPVRILEDKLASMAGMTFSGTNSRSHSVIVKKDGTLLHSRVSEHSGSRSATFGAASAAEGKLTLQKSLAIKSSNLVKITKDGKESSESNSYESLSDAPLQIEVVRESGTQKLISKTIKSGQIKIVRKSGIQIDLTYANVKFSEVCKPVSGSLQVAKVDPATKTANVLQIQFKDGEAWVSKNGGAEEKVESINYRLDGCKAPK
ncbi:hypothetical protein EBR21_00515 [bacterium]|nr:hypothetical protein [bacterium]